MKLLFCFNPTPRSVRCYALFAALGAFTNLRAYAGDSAVARTAETELSGKGRPSAYVQSGFEDAAAAARSTIESVRKEGEIPGMSAAVWFVDEIVWSEANGLADFEHQVPVTHETRFRLGRCSKILTASLVARLVQAGKVDLDQDIREHLPSFPEKGSPITLRQLLGHLAGIRHYTGKDFDFSAPGGIIDLRPYPSTESALALFRDDPLIASPGAKYAYSTFGYTLIAAVVEAAAKRPFLDLMRDELLDPLGLSRTCADDWRTIVPHRTSYFDKTSDGTIVHAAPVSQAYKWAGGGMLSTADDLARFGAAHLAPGFLSAETLHEMFTRQKTASGQESNVGLGWRIGEDSSGRRIVHHAGSMGGCRAVLVVYPAERLAVAMLSNLSGTPGPI